MIGDRNTDFSVLNLIENREEFGELLVVFRIKRLKTTESKKQVRVNQAIDGVIRLFTDSQCSLYSQS